MSGYLKISHGKWAYVSKQQFKHLMTAAPVELKKIGSNRKKQLQISGTNTSGWSVHGPQKPCWKLAGYHVNLTPFNKHMIVKA